MIPMTFHTISPSTPNSKTNLSTFPSSSDDVVIETDFAGINSPGQTHIFPGSLSPSPSLSSPRISIHTNHDAKSEDVVLTDGKVMREERGKREEEIV
jgi:hypothetical protein